MFAGIISGGSKALGGARFSLVNLLPGVVLVAIVLSTFLAGAYGSGPASVENVIPDGDQLTAGGAVLLLFAIFVVGVLIQPFQVALVQLLEGYWGDSALGGSFRTLATERHIRRFRSSVVRLDTTATPPTSATLRHAAMHARADAKASALRSKATSDLRKYPTQPRRLMPTMLGNILRDAEDTAGSRYGLDMMTAFPRMYPTLSKSMSDALAVQLDLIAVTASMCVSFALAALATAPVLMRLDAWSLIPVAAAALSALSYRASMRAAQSHGTLLATSFDLHRFDMLRALHYRPPPNAADEQVFNEELTTFLQSRQPPHEELAAYDYDHSLYDQAPAPLVPTAPEDGQGKSEEVADKASGENESNTQPETDGARDREPAPAAREASDAE